MQRHRLAIPPALGLWSRLKGLFKPAPITLAQGLEHRVDELEAEVIVLQTQVAYAQTQLQNLQVQVGAWGQPQAVLPTDVFLGGKRYTATGEAYWTTSNGPTDRWIAGARVSDDGSQVMVVP